MLSDHRHHCVEELACCYALPASHSARLQLALVLVWAPDYKAGCDRWFVDTETKAKCWEGMRKTTPRDDAFLVHQSLKKINNNNK